MVGDNGAKTKDEKNKYTGKLITFCGLDGCGKTTLINMLSMELKKKGYPVVITKQPTEKVRQSEIFRTFMDTPDHEMYDYRSLSLLAASDRIQHTNRYIIPLLKEGAIVISDRYFYSCLANLRARGYCKDKWIYEIAEHIIEPDLAIFLEVEAKTAIGRVLEREEERNRYVDFELQCRLNNEYSEISQFIYLLELEISLDQFR